MPPAAPEPERAAPLLAGSGQSVFARSGALFAAIGAANVVLVALFQGAPGPLSRHMLLHIFLMSAAAPAIALLMPRKRFAEVPLLVAATLLQIAAFFFWHSPSGAATAAASVETSFFMQATLLGAACFFWMSVFANAERNAGLAIGALLLTGKLFCLMAALWVFSPRPLFAAHAAHATALSDQQSAGIIMLAFCPLTYLAAALIILLRQVLFRRSDASASAAPAS